MGFTSDEGLLERCRAGHADAWDALVLRYRRLVWSVILRHRLREEEREDLFQQVFAALVEHLDAIREEGALPAWLTTTTKRLCWRAAARERRAPGGTAAVSIDADQSEGTGADAWPLEPADPKVEAADVQALAERQLVRVGLEQLGGRCRDLLEALFGGAGEPNYALISERLGIRVGSIGPTRQRCLEKLSAILRRLGFGDGDSTGSAEGRSGRA